MKNKVNSLEAGGSTCHEFTSKDEENKEIKIKHENQQKVVNSMKVNYEKAIKENNDLELKLMGINIT